MKRAPDTGYGHAHRQERKRWAPKVQRGEVYCHAVTCLYASRWIAPGSAWDLGHSADRKVWTGPEHMSCNRSEGASRGNRLRASTETPPPFPRNSQDW